MSDSQSFIDPLRLGVGQPDSTKFLRGDQTWSPPELASTAQFGHEAYTMQDEFIGGGTATGAVGELGWTLSGNGTYAVQASTSLSPGIGRVTSGATSGNSEAATLGPWLLPQIDTMEFIWKPATATNTGSARYGAGLGATLRNAPTDGVSVEADLAVSASFMIFSKWISSTRTTYITSIPYVAGGLYLATLEVTGAGEVTMTLKQSGGVAVTQVLTGISQTVAMDASFFAVTTNNNNKSTDVDYWSGSFSGLTRG
jgi:hypothetical protein